MNVIVAMMLFLSAKSADAKEKTNLNNICEICHKKKFYHTFDELEFCNERLAYKLRRLNN